MVTRECHKRNSKVLRDENKANRSQEIYENLPHGKPWNRGDECTEWETEGSIEIVRTKGDKQKEMNRRETDIQSKPNQSTRSDLLFSNSVHFFCKNAMQKIMSRFRCSVSVFWPAVGFRVIVVFVRASCPSCARILAGSHGFVLSVSKL